MLLRASARTGLVGADAWAIAMTACEVLAIPWCMLEFFRSNSATFFLIALLPINFLGEFFSSLFLESGNLVNQFGSGFHWSLLKKIYHRGLLLRLEAQVVAVQKASLLPPVACYRLYLTRTGPVVLSRQEYCVS